MSSNTARNRGLGLPRKVGLRGYYEAVTARCSTGFRNPRLALLSQMPNLPLEDMVSAIFFMPKSSKVFLVGQPWSVSQPSNL